MGILSALQVNPVRPWQQGQGGAPAAPQGPMPSGPQFGGLQGAFSQHPQFQQQLAAMMAGQGPGHQPPQFTPPVTPMTTAPVGPIGQGGFGGDRRGLGLLGMMGGPQFMPWER